MKSYAESNVEAVTPNVLRWAAVATVLQVGVTVLAHLTEFGFRNGGTMAFAVWILVAALYSADVRRSVGDAAWHGGMVAGIGGFLGTALAVSMADRGALALLTTTLLAIGVGALAGAFTHGVVGTHPRWTNDPAGPV